MFFNKFTIIAILSLALLRSYGQQQKSIHKNSEEQLNACILKAMEASVYIIEYDTLRDRVKEGLMESDGFSGVVVSAEGHILTVSHAAVPGEVYQIRFSNGNRSIAKGLGRIGIQADGTDYDMAMLKITKVGKWAFAEMGNTASLRVGDPLIGISYPSSFFKQYPNVRLGTLTDSNSSDGFITSTVKMEPGDSGGPLFDSNGRVIGIHSYINENETQNFDVPIEFYLKYWSALNIAKDYTSIPEKDKVPAFKKSRSLKVYNLEENPLLQDVTSKNTVAIVSNQGSKQVHILGTKVNTGSRTVIVSKNSMIGTNPVVSIDGKNISLQVVNRDRENDLIIMHAPELTDHGIEIAKEADLSPMVMRDLGKFFISDLGEGRKKMGVLGAMALDLPAIFSVGYPGANAVYQDGKITFSEITGQDTLNAILKVGDQVLKINRVPITEAADYDREFAKYLAGDSISLNLLRDGKPLQASIYLLGQPTFKHVSFDYPGGRSDRSDSYKQVLVQDAAILPEECGGPVFDQSGKFCGINIARHSRTSTIIVPVSILSAYVHKHTSTY